jgi:hypothetical protein
MENREILVTLANQLEMVQTDSPAEKLRELIRLRISDLITNDFNRLVMLLYQLDVSEKKLNACLEENKKTDAATIITELIIERQLQKAQSRKQEHPFKKDNNIPEDEKW